ncbi:MAG: hypothetical protein ACK4MV_21350 [Beijerinckiaceae bacterium]
MSHLEFERMLAALLPSPGKTALTLTEVPEGDDQLTRMLESAIRLGERQSSRLSEIHLPTGRMSATGAFFRDIPVEDGGDVLRLVFGN